MPDGEIRAPVAEPRPIPGGNGHQNLVLGDTQRPVSGVADPRARELRDLDAAFDEDGLLSEELFHGVEARLVEEERWTDLAELYALAAQRAPEGELGRRMLLSAGLLWFEKLQDGVQAEQFLRRLLASDAENIDALDTCRAICIQAGRFDEAADLLDRAIAAVADEEKPELLIELAQIAYEELHQVERAVTALRYAYECAPHRLEVLVEARRIFIEEERFADAKHVLDDESAAVFGADGTSFADPQRQEAARAVAEAYRQLGIRLLDAALMHKVAEECLEKARALGDNDALSKVDELAHIKKEWEARAKLLRDEALEARDKRKAAQLYLRAAELYHAYGKDPIRADEYLERCMLLCPGYGPALTFIETTHLEQKRGDDLVRKLNAMAAAVKDPAVKIQILLRVAHLLESNPEIHAGASNKPNDPPATQVIAAYRRALAIDPGHREAVLRVKTVLEEQGLHVDIAEILAGQLAAVEDEYTKVQDHLELGRIYAEMLGDSTRARAHFEAVLALSPMHFDAASALRALYKDAGEHPLHLSVLKVLVEYSPDLFSRLEILHETAGVAEQVSKEEAFAVYRRIFELDPNASKIEEKLEKLANELGRHLALADAYMGAARKRGKKRAFELWLAAARLFDQRVPRPQDALFAYRRALELEPDSQECHDALERLLREQHDPAALVEVLKAQLARNTDPEQALILASKIGAVLDRDLGDLEGAIRMFAKVLELQPKNVAALSNLDDLYRRREDWNGLVGILIRREAFAETPSDLADLQFRRARVLEERLNRGEEAAELYLDVLSRFPDHAEVIHALGNLLVRDVFAERIARALEPLFQQRGQFARQLDMLGILLEKEQDPKVRRDLARRAAQVAEQRLDDPEAAFDFISGALKDDPESEEARESFLRLMAKTNAQKAAVEILASILERDTIEQAAVSPLAAALAEIYDAVLDDKPKAIEFYQRALRADGGNAVAIAALERLLGAQERWDELASLLEERMSRSSDRQAKVNLGLALAQIRERLDDLDRAIDAYREVLAVDSTEGTALSKLAHALERQERFRELVGVLDRMRDASPDPDLQAATEVKVGDVLRTRLNDRSGALKRYESALAKRPDNQGAVRGLEALLEDVEMRPQAGALLEPYYEGAERWRDLVLALESQLSSAVEADRRKALFLRIANVEREQLAQTDAAFETLSRAFREGLINRDERSFFAEIAIVAHCARELANLYEDHLTAKGADEDLLRELARLYDGEAADVQAANRTWNRLLEVKQNDAEALEALERLQAAGDNPAALAEVLLRRAEASQGGERVAFLKRASAIYEEAAEDLPRAIDAMDRARLEQPRDRSTLQELQRLYGLADKPEKIRDMLESEAQLVEEPLQRANVLVQLAEVSVKLEMLDDAVAGFEAALAAMPDHKVARDGLEALLKSAVGPRAALALEPIYRAAADWSHLVEAYEILARASEDPAERVERLVAIRSIYEERLGKPDRAFQAAARAYREQPRNEELLVALERLGRLSGQVHEMLALLEDQAEQLPYVSQERYEVRIRIARFTEQLIRDRALAIETWKRVLEERPESLIALEALERLHTRAGDARELVEVLRTMAGLLEDPKDRAPHLRRAATILDEKLGERVQAARVYEQVLTIMPGDLESLKRLDAIYTEMRAYEELANILGELIQVAKDQKERSLLLLRLGRLREKALHDPRGALNAYAAVLQEGPKAAPDQYESAIKSVEELVEQLKNSNPELAAFAAELIEPHFAQKGDFIKVVAAKQARVATATDPEARRVIRFEIADVYENKLDQPEMAFVTLAHAYGEFPADAELAQRLERLATIAQTEEELADLYAQALPAIEDDQLVLRLARKVAYIFDNVLERGESAVPYYDRVLSIVPDDAGAHRALERIHRRAGNAAALVDVYRSMLKLAGEDRDQQKTIWKEIARITEEDLHDLDGAFEAYRAMLAIDPDDLHVLRPMGALCERSNRFEDLAIVLSREAELTPRADDKAQVLLRLATVKKDRLQDIPGAVQAYSSVLEARPNDPGAIAGLAAVAKEGGDARARAAAALAPVYLSSGAFSDYIACLEAQLNFSRRAEDRKALLIKIADTYEQRLGRPEHAFTYLSRALREDLFDEKIRIDVERLAEENNLREDLAAFYLDEIDKVDDHEMALFLRRRVAEIYDHELKDVTRAIAEYNKILDVAPGDPESLKALERLYRAAGSFGSLAEVYRRRIAQTDDKDARAHLLREFGRLQADELKDAPGAIATLRRLLDLVPTDVDALTRLARLCEDQGRASELADVLTRLIAAAEESSKVQIDAKFKLGKLKADRLGDLGGADVLFSDVLAVDPEHEKTREHLQERLENALAEDDAKLAQKTGEILADAMRRAGEHQSLISVLNALANLAEQPIERVQIKQEIAAIYRQRLKQPELAFSTLAQVFREAPGIEEVRVELEELAEELLMSEELVEVLEAGLPNIPDSELSLAVERRIAQLLEVKIGDRDRAAVAWQRVLDDRPMDPEALEAMDRLNTALGRWAALADVIEKRIELIEGNDEDKHEMYVRLGAIWDERLGEKEEATNAYRKARALDPRDKETLLALSRLIDPNESPEELFAVLEALSEQAKGNMELLRYLPRMASLAAMLQKRSEAIDLWKRVHSIDPNHAEATKGLEALYEHEGRWEELAKHLERQLGLARDEKEMIRIQRRIGLIKGTRLGSVDEAVRSWSEILKRNPNDVEALQALRQTYREAGRFEELVATLRKLIPLQVDADGVKQIRFELAEVFLSKLNQRDEAIESAKRVLDVEPHTEPELMRLEEIFVATGAYGEAVKVMNARVELADRASEKIDILFDVATTYESRIGRRAGAAAAYEKILQLAPTSVKAYDALAAIYEANGDYRKLVELYNRRLDTTEEAAERKKILWRIIDIQEKWLGQPELAFTAACRAFAEEGADETAQGYAERLAEETDNWGILAEVFEEQIDQVGAARGIDLRRRLGEIYLTKIADPARAEHQLDLVLSSRPEDEAARKLLIGIFESQGRWKDLIGQIHDQVEIAPDVEHKKALFRRMSNIEETRLQDVEAAISSTKRILDLDSEDKNALDELTRIFRTSEKWHPLLSALGRKLELATDKAERVEIRFEIAGVWETGIGDVEHAIESYRDVLAVDENHLPSLRALERLFTSAERWIELVDVFERQVALADDEKQAIALLTRIAGIWEEEFRDLEGASATLIRILEIDPEHLQTVKSLERVWRQANDWERLLEAYSRHVELTDEPRESVELYVAIGEIQLRELGRIPEAEEAYKKALGLDQNSLEAIHALGQLYERTGNWYSALDMLQKEANLGGNTPEAVETLFRMGKINEDMLMDKEAAKTAYQRALNLDPSFAPAMRSLRHVYFDEGNFSEVIQLQAQEAEYSENKNEAAQLLQQAAETAIDELDDVGQALKLYEKSLEAVPDHVPSLRALGDLYFAEESWEKAEKLLEKLVEKLDRHDDLQELCRQQYRLAYIAEKLDDDHRALKRYLASYELDSTYLPTLEGLAAALLRAERWEDAQRIFQTILIHHKGSLTDAEVVDLHYQLGELAAKLEQWDRAKKSFDKALDLDQEHAQTLRAYAKLAETMEEWEEAYDLRERLIQHIDPDEKFEELVNQAKLCRDKIQEPYRAIDAFSEARRLKPKDPEVLRALVKLFEETSQAQRTIDALLDLSDVVSDPKDRRDIYFGLAKIYADEQKNVSKAVETLNKALDLDPTFIKAFEKIEQLLSQTKQWPLLEENYHRMIKRMPKEQKQARIVLWKSLGDLYQKVLKNDEGTKVALEVVLGLDPDSQEVMVRLAEIYARSRDTAPKAVSIYHKVFPVADDPAPPAHRLFELYTALGSLDRGFCALSSLLLMRGASQDEQKAYNLLLKKAPQSAKRSLTDNLWRTVVLDPNCRSSLADISSVLYRGAPELFGENQKALQLKKKEKVDLTDAGKNARVRLRYFDVWQRLANAMHVGEMDHYHRAGSTQPPRLYPGSPPVLFVGEQHEAFKEMAPRQIAWVLARQMACARPELALVKALSPEDVAAVMEAAIQLWYEGGSGIDLQIDPKLVQEWMRALRRTLTERALKALKEPVVTCVERREMRHLARFIEGAEHSASRAALLMAGDVAVAERGLGDSDQLVDVSFRARVRALMLYTLSEDYFILREKLGLMIT
jgi:tetratricopeptide (TPR) repeat protein